MYPRSRWGSANASRWSPSSGGWRSFLIIRHNFEQVMRLPDEVWVMRHGNVVGHRHTAETTADELVALITGAKSSDARLHVSEQAKESN